MSYHYSYFDFAATVTHTGFLATLASWSLHLPELAIIVSALASIAGVSLQFWLAFGKMSKLEEAQRQQEIANAINSARVGAVEDRQTFQEIKPAPIVVVPVPVIKKDEVKK